MEEESLEKSNQARLKILELASMISVPMSLNAIIRLDVPDAIWQGGANIPVTTAQILKRILPSGGDAENLQRVLRMLTSYGIFAEHIDSDGSDRKYSLTEVGKMLATGPDGSSCAPYVLQHHQDELMRAWPFLSEALVDPTTQPFVKANGELAYDYYGKRPEMSELMEKAMSGLSVPFMKAILEGYDGFKGVNRLVDVGGSAGESLSMILDKNPNIREGINFDLPEVVARAPHIPGVRHVGGDMFTGPIPEADAVFMKWILTWTDDECKKIMEICNKALPEGGKLIACEPVLPAESDDSHRTRALLEADIFLMTIYRTKGKHRTAEEFRKLGLSAGFPNFRVIYINFFTVLEFGK